MNLKFSIVAEKEIEAAADYYENEEAGLGFQFIEELNRAITFVLQFPNAWSPISKRSRRCTLRRCQTPKSTLFLNVLPSRSPNLDGPAQMTELKSR